MWSGRGQAAGTEHWEGDDGLPGPPIRGNEARSEGGTGVRVCVCVCERERHPETETERGPEGGELLLVSPSPVVSCSFSFTT